MNTRMLFTAFLFVAGLALLPALHGCGNSGGGCEDLDGDAYFAQPGCGTAQDCDDSNPNAHPMAQEGPYLDPSCGDAADNDCDGATDDEDIGCFACVDLDGDGYGSPPSEMCTFPQWDCDDTDPDANPGEVEVPENGIDEDCNVFTPQWPTPASTVEPGHTSLSDVANVLFIALIPAGILLLLKRSRRGR